MKIKGKNNYMQGAEFRARQAFFAFAEYSRAALDYLTQFRRDCRKGWNTLFTKKPRFQQQLDLDFMRKISDWANWTPTKNHNLFTPKVNT